MTNIAAIIRDKVGEPGSETATLGKLYVAVVEGGPGSYLCETLELPWNGNQHNVSCVGPGTYPLVYKFSEKHGRDLWHLEVPFRDDIEIHIGNGTSDTEGCVLVGAGRGDNCITQSHAAFDKLYGVLAPYVGRDDISLTITNPE